MPNPNGTPANLKPPWKPGKSANPKGRPSVGQKLKELREEFGDWPRTELMRMAKDKRLKPETRVRVLQYLDEQFNGKSKQTTELMTPLRKPVPLPSKTKPTNRIMIEAEIHASWHEPTHQGRLGG